MAGMLRLKEYRSIINRSVKKLLTVFCRPSDYLFSFLIDDLINYQFYITDINNDFIHCQFFTVKTPLDSVTILHFEFSTVIYKSIVSLKYETEPS